MKCSHPKWQGYLIRDADAVHDVWVYTLSCDPQERTRQVRILNATVLAISDEPHERLISTDELKEMHGIPHVGIVLP